MSKSAGKQTTTNQLDPQTQAMRQEVFNRARQVSDQPFSQYGGQTVAGADPMSYEGAIGMRGAGGQYNDLYNAARNFQGAPNMGFGSGLNMNGGFNTSPYSQAGATGAAALGGDQGAIGRLMNPYQNQVIDAMNGQYDRLRKKSVLDTNDLATQQGAYGGDRAALLQGERLGQIDQGQAGTIADLLHGGYQDMMGNANNAANLGLGGGQLSNGYQLGVGSQNLQGQQLGANYALGRSGQQLDAMGQAGNAAGGSLAAGQGLLGAGNYFRDINQAGMDDAMRRFNEQRDWGLRGLNVLQGGMSGMPYGNSQSTPLTRNVGSGVLGGAATGASIGSIIPGLGTGIGAGIGGLLGLFG